MKQLLLKARWIFVLILQFTLMACATGSNNMFFHSFSFSTIHDSPDVEVLDYQYGGSGIQATYAPKERVAKGEVFGQDLMAGVMPRGEFLYVKWRLKETGQVYEDKVDLRNRLPADITNYEIHFAIKGPQLYIYAMPPPGRWPAVWLRNPVISPEIEALLKKHQIYPDPAK